MKRTFQRPLALLLTFVMLLGLLPGTVLATESENSASGTSVELLTGEDASLSSAQLTFRLFPIKENTTSSIVADGYFQMDY